MPYFLVPRYNRDIKFQMALLTLARLGTRPRLGLIEFVLEKRMRYQHQVGHYVLPLLLKVRLP